MTDPTPEQDRPPAPGGWRRAVVGLLLGAGLGVVFTRLLPRDDQRGGGR